MSEDYNVNPISTDPTLLKSAGDILINKLFLITKNQEFIDIQNQVLSINVYEDLFASFITGNVVIQDPLSMISNMPIIGEEFLDLNFCTPGMDKEKDSIKGKFSIYKISDYEYLQNRVVGYTIHFVSSEAILDLNIKISKAFNKRFISDIASEILCQYSITQNNGQEPTPEQRARFNIEETQNGHTYVSNFWSPVKNLNYLAEHAMSKQRTTDTGKMTDGSPTYLFFENRNGLNFISLESLYIGSSKRTFTYNDFNRDFKSDGSSVRNIEKDYSNIIVFKMPEAFNYMDKIRGGAYSSNLFSYNLTTKVYKSQPFNYLDNYDTSARLNEFSPASKKVINSKESCYVSLTKSNALFSNSLNDISNSKILQKRMSILSLSNSIRIQITVYGRTDYTVGQVVTIDINKEQPTYKSDTNTKDEILSGNYIISSIRHYIDRTYHECVMELIKDSMIIDMNG